MSEKQQLIFDLLLFFVFYKSQLPSAEMTSDKIRAGAMTSSVIRDLLCLSQLASTETTSGEMTSYVTRFLVCLFVAVVVVGGGGGGAGAGSGGGAAAAAAAAEEAAPVAEE